MVVAGTGQPARRVRVNVSSPDARVSRTLVTDDSGLFSATGLPGGRFNLSASKPGYITGSFGQRLPGRSGMPIQLADGQKVQVQVQIWRGGVITGTLLDEHGEAVPNTPVRVMRYVMPGGQRTLQQSGSGQTDDRGVYRIFGLQPGEYIVSAAPRNSNLPSFNAEPAVAAALERAGQTGQVNPDVIQIVGERLTQLRGELSQAGDGPSTGYAPTYYPGTTSVATAASITLAPGEEKGGIDFQYQVVPVARVEGLVTSTQGPLPPNVTLSLVSNAFNVPGMGVSGVRADGNGAFRFNNVPPGQYTLVARGTSQRGREGGPLFRGLEGMPGGRGQMPPGGGRGRAGQAVNNPVRLWGAVDVNVDGSHLSNIVVMLQPGLQVSGRVSFDGTSQPPEDLSRLRVSLQSVTTPGAGDISTNVSERVEADGRFTFQSVVPGRYRLTGGGAGGEWIVAASAMDGENALDFPVEIKTATSGAVVTFTDRHSELTGTITDDRSQPVVDYTLVVYPSEPRFRVPQSRRILSARPDTAGRFTFSNLPPGDYRLAPVLDPEPGSWFDPAFLQQLDDGALRVSIAEGEKKEQNLRVPGGA